jgi:protein O-GlcNAc transferase
VQVSWLGYPGTMGTSFFDYIIADGYVVPPGEERHYTEKIVRLPDTYQPNDRKRPAAEPRTRTEHGLPAAGTVFCYLGKHSKINPEVFDDWMAIVRAVPDSVLWLLADQADMRESLRSEAARRGVAPERLHFTRGSSFVEHLARFRAADLALDTFPYGSHTTASEALWQGCPLVTRVGDTFASRVASSLLRAAGMPELVTTNAEEFRGLAIELGTDVARRTALRTRLLASRTTCALFDTPRFVRNLEAAYEAMHSRAAMNLPPTHLDVR